MVRHESLPGTQGVVKSRPVWPHGNCQVQIKLAPWALTIPDPISMGKSRPAQSQLPRALTSPDLPSPNLPSPKGIDKSRPKGNNKYRPAQTQGYYQVPACLLQGY